MHFIVTFIKFKIAPNDTPRLSTRSHFPSNTTNNNITQNVRTLYVVKADCGMRLVRQTRREPGHQVCHVVQRLQRWAQFYTYLMRCRHYLRHDTLYELSPRKCRVSEWMINLLSFYIDFCCFIARFATVIFTTIRPLAHTSKPFGNICTYTPTQIFTFCTVYNGNLHVPAKFHLDRLNGWGDIANF